MTSDQPALDTSSTLRTPDAAFQLRVDDPLPSPSARTSFTRVDLGAEAEEDDGIASAQADPISAAGEGDQAPSVDPIVPQLPQASLTFLTVSGRRRTMSFEPETTIGRVKELVWNAWPNEWQDERPPAPSYLRILFLGKILQDDDTLIMVGFPTYIPLTNGLPVSDSTTSPTVPTIVHLSIRSYPPPGVKDSPKKISMRRNSALIGEDENRGAGCCSGCVVC